MISQKAFLIVILGQTYSPSSPGRPFTGPCGLVVSPNNGDSRVPNYAVSRMLVSDNYRNFLSRGVQLKIQLTEVNPRISVIESRFMVNMVSAFDDFPVPDRRIYVSADGAGSSRAHVIGASHLSDDYEN